MSDVWKKNGFHWAADLPARELQHLEFIERAMGANAIRAVPALLAHGISPYRTDQHDEIKRLAYPVLRVNYERAAACFGYINGKHIFETMLDPDFKPVVFPATAAGLCIFRLLTGIPLPELTVSKTACLMRAQGHDL